MVHHLHFLIATTLSVLVTTTCGQPVAEESLIQRDTSQYAPLIKRASSDYAPRNVQCPSQTPTIRSASSLSQNETAWLETRRRNTIPALRSFLTRANIPGFNVDNYFNDHSQNQSSLPNFGIAVSGGGYRALMNGAGALTAFDNRTSNSTATGHLGGLLQSATYLTGLSGGSWLVGSMYKSSFVPVPNIPSSLWQFDDSILAGPEDVSVFRYYDTIVKDIDAKEAAGFNTTFTDYWGRFLSYQLFNASTGSPGFTFSSLANNADFSSGRAPMPIVLADERAADELLISSNATIYEFNPWEMGSYDPGIFGYAPLQYLGSQFSAGTAKNCTVGFDNIGFVVGTSSSLFNQFYLNVNSTGASQGVKNILNRLLGKFGASNGDISSWPNPFYDYNIQTNSNSQNRDLTLVDGGEDLQNIPFHPLLRTVRNVDMIFAVDASADTTGNWPNGTAMVATYDRARTWPNPNRIGFPAVPDYNTFVNLGLNRRPTFFGCDANQQNGSAPPLVVYLPNTPYSYYSNTSTFQLSTNDSQRNSIIQNGYNVATRGNGTIDSQWPACVGCAIMSRSWNRTGTTVPDVCAQCFDRYCWNGTVNSTTPLGYNPTRLIASASMGSGAMLRHDPWALFGALVSIFALLQVMV